MAVTMVEFGGEEFVPLADRALFWPSRRTLIVSDVHVGKAAVFRARGLPVPAGITAKDLLRLSLLIETTGATRVLVLGDFLHAKESHDAQSHVRQWLDRHAGVRVELVPGNHDRSAGALDPSLGITVLDPVHIEGGYAFVHDPAVAHELPVMSGHVHPQVRLKDFDGTGVSVPCFVVEPSLMILPAFGSFTGGCRVAHSNDRRLLAAAAGRVIEVAAPPALPWRAGGAGRTTRARRSPSPPSGGSARGPRS